MTHPAGYRAALETAALHDRSAWGRLRGEGRDVVDLLHRISTNDLRGLAPGRGASTVFTDPDARVIDRVEILALEDGFLLVTSPGGAETLRAWIDRYTISEDAAFHDATPETALFTLHGPRSGEVLERVFPGTALPAGAYEHTAAPLPAGGRSSSGVSATGVRIARARRLSGPAFDLHVAAEGASPLRERLLEAGRDLGLVPLPEEEHEILRIEAGRPRLGAEFSRETNPHEAGLIEDVSFTKGCYIGQEVVARLDTYEKVRRFLRGIRFDGGEVPAPGALLHAAGGADAGGGEAGGLREAGRITSAALSPRAGRALALALIRKGLAEPGTRLEAGRAPSAPDGSSLSGEVVPLPFFPAG